MSYVLFLMFANVLSYCEKAKDHTSSPKINDIHRRLSSAACSVRTIEYSQLPSISAGRLLYA